MELERELLLDPDLDPDPDPLAEEVDGEEDVAEGVGPSEVYPGGKVDTFGMVVEPVADAAAAPANAANPTAGGSNRYTE